MDASSTRGTQPVDVVARASSPVHPPPADEHGTLDCGGARIAYAVWRDTRAPTVVLVHGGRAHSAWWHPVIATGCLGDVRIVTLDLSGHGDSDRRDTYRPELWAAEVASVVATGSGKALLVGHSMGGLVSVVAAARHPALVDGLVLVDTTCPMQAIELTDD